MTAIHIEHASKRFGTVAAVDDFSLAVEDGEFLVLLGPSGCGKTTTLRMVAGFLDVTSGTIRIGERDVTRLPPHRRNIGFVFQNYALFPHLSVHENVAFGLRRRKVADAECDKRVNEALALVKLEGYGTRLPRELSGGQQQRVAIARALAIKPDVLLLDEPLSNLDARLRHDVRQELRRLQKLSGITTVMVTHDQDEAMSVGDRLVVMNSGRIEQVGTPQALYREPATRFVASFVGRGNFLPGKPADDLGSFVTASGLTIAAANLQRDHDTLLVRPENVSMERAGGTGANCFPATVEVATFLGSSFETTLRLANGDLLAAVAPGSRATGATDWCAGDSVTARIDPEAASGLHAGSAGNEAGNTGKRNGVPAA
jgi:ABC-type Fe3+/spermidine/putrescine transport system ATPase subunit